MIIEMELMSDAIPYSGEGVAGIIDIDITYDEYGIPYIPAKRIKGILRESAQDLLDVGEIDNEIFKNIFGTSGGKNISKLKISDGLIKKYDFYKDIIEKTENNSYLINKNIMLDYFTYLRTNTTIEDGVAKENSLRVFRVLHRGLKFVFECDIEDKYKDDFNKIVKVTRHFGLSRTRGFGKIRMRVVDMVNDSNKEDSIDFNKNFDALYLILNNVSHIFLSNKVNDMQQTLNYIPGSVLLGSLASLYIRKNNLENPHKDETFKKIFLSNEIIFENLYPADSDNIYYPSSAALKVEKDTKNIFDLTNIEDLETIRQKNIQTKGGIGEFSLIDSYSGKIKTKSVDNEINYHHKRPDDRSKGKADESDGTFFQFEVLSKGQEFGGYIKGDKTLLQKIYETLRNEKYLYIGKSSTAQYGKALFNIKEHTFSNKNNITVSSGESFAITLLTDLILRNDNGFIVPDSDILKKEIEEILSINGKLKIDDEVISSVNYTLIGGFNAVWGFPKIQMQAISAGSTIVFRNNSDEKIDISVLEGKHFGIRTNEGFGKVTVNLHYNKKIKYSEKEKLNKENLSFEELKTNKNFKKYIYKRFIKNRIKKHINVIGNGDLITNAHQLSRLMLFVKNSKSFEDLNTKLGELRKPSRIAFLKIKENVFFEEKDKKIKVDSEKFKNRLKEKVIKKDEILRELKDEGYENIINYINSNLFNFYKEYVLYYLQRMKYILRTKKRGGGGK